LETASGWRFSNNTDIRLDHSQIEFAQDNLRRVRGPFDSSGDFEFCGQPGRHDYYTDRRRADPEYADANDDVLGISQLFQTGTNFQTSFSTSKLSNELFGQPFEPFAAEQFAIHWLTQPLLKNFWAVSEPRTYLDRAKKFETSTSRIFREK